MPNGQVLQRQSGQEGELVEAKLMFTLQDPGCGQEDFGERAVKIVASLGDAHPGLKQEELWAALKMGPLELTLTLPWQHPSLLLLLYSLE